MQNPEMFVPDLSSVECFLTYYGVQSGSLQSNGREQC